MQRVSYLSMKKKIRLFLYLTFLVQYIFSLSFFFTCYAGMIEEFEPVYPEDKQPTAPPQLNYNSQDKSTYERREGKASIKPIIAVVNISDIIHEKQATKTELHDLQELIKEVSESNSYALTIDSRAGLIFVNESLDISEIIMQELDRI